MLKAVAFLGAIGLGGFFALDRIEREMLYPFDTTRIAPEDLGLDLREELFESGGERLVLWAGQAEAGKPCLLYFHGNAGNLAARAGRFARFRARGYGLVAPGYRGSSGSTGTPLERNLAYDAARLFKRIGDYCEGPVVLYGESLGTGVALAAVAETGKQPAGVVLEAPYTSIKAVALRAYPQIEPLAGKMKNEWDSLRRIKALKAPLLVLHGTEDALIPIEMGRRLFSTAPMKDKQFIAVKGGHHTDLWRSDVLPALWRFIDAAG